MLQRPETIAQLVFQEVVREIEPGVPVLSALLGANQQIQIVARGKGTSREEVRQGHVLVSHP